MSIIERARYAGLRLFGAAKRPMSDAVYALSGKRMQSKAEYLDFGLHGGLFEAPVEQVQRRLPSGFDVVQNRPGSCELEIWAADYRRMDILRPYREIAVMVPVRLRRPREPAIEGTFTLHMAVTTEEARWTGVDIHGFPKIVADIDIHYEGGSVTCTCHHRGVHVLTLRVEERPTEHIEDRVILLNVRKDGRVIQTPFERSGELGESEGPGGVSLELGTHAIADQLRAMEVRLDSGRATYLPHCHAVLGKAVDLGPLSGELQQTRGLEPAEEAGRPIELRPS